LPPLGMPRWSTIACLSPSRWRAAVEQIAPIQILPSRLVKGSTTSNNKRRAFLAWYGDKVLGAAVGRVLKNHARINTSSRATACLNVAVSNWFLAANSKSILPEPILGTVARSPFQLGEHNLGTTLEAAVAKVYETDDHAAVEDLAEWLVEKALALPDQDPKGKLLSLGGVVDSRKRQLGNDDNHEPMVDALARSRCGRSARGVATSKKKAERLAAANLLKKMGIIEALPAAVTYSTAEVEQRDESSSLVDNAPPTTTAMGEWIKEKYEPTAAVDIALENKSITEWWSRGASDPKMAFHRAMLAPLAFPDTIKAVDFWIRKASDDFSSTFMIITHHCKQSGTIIDHTTPIFRGSSITRERKSLGLEANKFILSIVRK